MNASHQAAGRVTCAVALAAATWALTACGSPIEQAEDLAVSMGNATPAASPAAQDPTGAVHPFASVRDLDSTGDLLGVRTEDSLVVGKLEQVLSGNATTYSLDDACGDVSANAGTFAVACGDTIRLFREDGEESFAAETPVTAATVTSTGEVLAASDTDRSVWLYKDGALERTFSAARETTQLQAVPVDGQPDTVVRTNSFDTTIQDMDWGKGRQGGTLRVGLGMGKIAGGDDGLVLAADATGSQLLVYTSDDIIRLHQMIPVAESPWDVAWDTSNRLAWIASTATNTASGYDISRGVPLVRASVRTVADAQSMVSLDDATLVLASASGDGLQVVRAADLDIHPLPESDEEKQ